MKKIYKVIKEFELKKIFDNSKEEFEFGVK
jgi:hypothetical protein